MQISTKDTDILRRLAERVVTIAETDLNRERRDLWYRHDALEPVRPLLLTETDAGLGLVLPDFAFETEHPDARHAEYNLRDKLAHFEVIGDDRVVEPTIPVGWSINVGNYGVEVHRERATDSHGGHVGYHWDPPIKELPEDLDLLRQRIPTIDRETTMARIQRLQDAVGDMINVRLGGNPFWSQGLTQQGILLIGLEELMVYMYEEPEALHRFMKFLCDDQHAFLDWIEQENLLNANNADDYVGSGSLGYSHMLPREDSRQGPYQTQDLWALVESQETVGISPEMFDEFIFPYQESLAKRFGKVYYGCCEPVNNRWHILKRLKNLSRVSVSPWADEEFMAREMGANYVYARKPNPTLISTEVFDEEAIRRDLRHTLELTHTYGCPTEIVMKDVHTLSGEHDRLTRWVQIAREEIQRIRNV